ncbi:MAG: hypothetical protein LBV17_04015 [Treponema sp.]|jgi:hypothetical protein|nr:hypothetical protein [Treponema sp.]
MTIQIDDKKAKSLSLFLKRITYEDAFRRTDVGFTAEARKEQAYRFLDVVMDLEKSLYEGIWKQINTQNKNQGLKR